MKKCVLVICMLFVLCGCTEERIRQLETEMVRVNSQIGLVANAVEKVETTGDTVLDVVNTISAANTASTPFNPYAGVVAAALGGLSLFLEGQRRKEKGGRKYAEAKLNNK